MKQMLFWQRLDCPGLEQAEIETGAGLSLSASGSLLHADTGASLRYRMQLDHHAGSATPTSTSPRPTRAN